MIGLNLLPDVKKEYLKSQRTRNRVVSIAVLAMVIAAGLTVLLALFVYAGQAFTMMNLTGQIKDSQKILSEKPDIDNYLTVQNQLAALGPLHSQKSITSRVFEYLQKLNPAAPDNMTVTAVTVDKTQKTISMQGRTDNFRSMDVVKTTLERAKISYILNDTKEEKPLFSDVTLVTASLNQASGSADNREGVMFDFLITFDPVIFQQNITNIEVIVPQLKQNDTTSEAQ